MKQNSSASGKFMKFLQFPVTRFFLGFFLIGLVTSIAQIGTEVWPGHVNNLAQIASVLIIVTIASLAYYGFVRVIEKRAVTELSPHQAVRELAGGAALGALLFSATIGILWLFGFYKVSGTNAWTVLIPGLVLSISSGVIEEILIRGLLFRIMEETLGTWIALAISAVIFGFLHLANPNATLWGAIAIAIEAGIMLAAAYVFTRRLWLPIGIHFAWNFSQGAIFGVAVSGNEVQGLLQSTLSGPTLLSGGAFGAEASIIAVMICLLAGIALTTLAMKKGNFIQPFWAKHKPELKQENATPA
ncbi:MAG TPA: CPBP family intramembrane metalloprotease [Anaerolineales bacterium]|nr:CPBP family intramembrane metalloprotease [Anaerolineales bacterium]HMV94766.1 CPBP family intramembrane metalloprotease [Anaerolineales bacterium]HMX72945.1 CPBP family intramembrane metalloprotease [Anaerolineales bacterium]HMZ41840.1 CPBP family intramembrane metalloprotease [Anaerolineales bacterium]HNA52784.1 CPBP family intramembrane metalloprotease [Anaerolineales bacterium]